MSKYLGDDSAISKASLGFSARSNGVLNGAVSAVDGWLMSIVRSG